ncbi:ribonuclease 3 [Episyrphus balteatus]|uniref:ribonuclease 3 n=1 Tax=Episyrphus balteatus TaxID=286459 RepID=UPI002485DFFF|nr:ribonuclease 3 [Episyrphus balteatus]
MSYPTQSSHQPPLPPPPPGTYSVPPHSTKTTHHQPPLPPPPGTYPPASHSTPLPPPPGTYSAGNQPTSYVANVPTNIYPSPVYPPTTPTTFNPAVPPPPIANIPHRYYSTPLPSYGPPPPAPAQKPVPVTPYLHYPPPPPSSSSYVNYPPQPAPPGMASTEYPSKTPPPSQTSHSRTWYAPRHNLTYRNPAIRASSQPPPPSSLEHRSSYRPRKPFVPSSSYRSSSTRPSSMSRGATPSEGRSSSSSTYSSHHQSEKPPKKVETERDRLLKNWRSYFCETSEEIAKKLAELEENEEKDVWIRSSPADIYYRRTNNGNEVEGTSRLEALCNLFDEELVKRSDKAKAKMEAYTLPPRKHRRRLCKHKSEICSSSSSDSSDDEFKIEQDCCMEELSRKVQHPYRLHPDLWHNDPGEMNDGPLCRCSAKSRRIGIRHGIYPGEGGIPKCIPNSNNANKLYHYRITVSPPTNFLTKTPTIIKHDEHEFLFEGFSLFSHSPIDELPTCKVIRFNIEYTILYISEKIPENFTIQELELFSKYLFHELLELVDFSLLPNVNADTSCPAFHFLPRFVRDLADNGKEVLAMSEVLKYLLDNSGPLVDPERLSTMADIAQNDWQDYVDYIKGMVVTKPGQKPCSVRIDQLDRNVPDIPDCVDKENEAIIHPAIVHFGIRPPQLSYAGNPEYQKAWREYVKFRHLMANMSKPSYKDKRKLEEKEIRLQEMRTQGRMKRNITVAISSKGFYRTGIMCDVIQHAMLIPVLTGHLRFHQSLSLLEKNIGHKFKNRYLLQLALTHPSYKENFGTNPDHARNSLTNCGIRQPEYGDRKIHYMNTRKRGINTLINIMSRFGKEYETMSNITHNERLEFLGDAVVEFLSSIHLFFMFPDLEEGGLATYRAAIVQNQHLAVLSKKLQLEEYMLYAHGSDLCHELELRHAMANCFEALMGALLLDGGISVADKVFMNALFMGDETLKDIWKNLSEHPLQEQEPLGDRHCIPSYPVLQELTKFEDSIGIKFKHIRLLARAFTDRSIGFTHLTLGSNQRLEFLGDTVLQLICSEYLYRHFPEHHEGHLSLLRSSLVNNRTQAVVCDDLGMTQYAVFSNPKSDMKTKDRADLLEAFLGALYVDKGLMYCEQFCHVCLFPRLQMFIMNQDWNDPKSKLQQCCLTLRTMEGGEPDIPIYKVVESIGPTNTRIYTVAVYFRSKRLATATGHTIQQAEMNAAKQALENSRELFPQLDHQKRVIAKSIKQQTGDINSDLEDSLKQPAKKFFADDMDESHLPKQYRLREDISSDELPDDDAPNSDSDTVMKSKKKKKKSHTSKSPKKKHKKKRKRSRKTSSCSEGSVKEDCSLKNKQSNSPKKKPSPFVDDSLSPLSDDDLGDHIVMDDRRSPPLVITPSRVKDDISQSMDYFPPPLPPLPETTISNAKIEIPEPSEDKKTTNDLNVKTCKPFSALADVEDVSSSSEIESGELST